MLEHIRSLSNLTSLKFYNLADDSNPEDWLQISHLTNLKQFVSAAPLPVEVLKIIPNPAISETEDRPEETARSSRMEDLTIYSIRSIDERKLFTKSVVDQILHPTNLTRLELETICSNPTLDKLTNLKSLVIKDSIEGLESNHVAPIQFNKLPALEKLKIYAEYIDPKLRNNTALTSLQVRTKNVTEELFRSIAALTNLRVLTVQEENEGEDRTCYSPNWLKSLSLPNLERLNLALKAEGDGLTKMHLNPAKLTRLKLRFTSGFDLYTTTHLIGLQDIDLIESVGDFELFQLTEEKFEFLQEFSQLTRLTVVSSAPLNRNFSLYGLHGLKDVQLDAFDVDPNQLRLLTNLESLILQPATVTESQIFAFGELTKLSQLKFKLAWNFAQNSCGTISNLPKLQILDLLDTKIDQNLMNEILKITTLECLVVHHVVEDQNFAAMTALSNLSLLYLQNCKHSCKYLSCLTNLQEIRLQWLKYEDSKEVKAGLKGLTRLYNLHVLSVDDRSESDESYEVLDFDFG